jgi:hypothetical protein
LRAGRRSSTEEHLSLFADFIKEDGRLVFSKEDSRYSVRPSDLKEVQGRYCKYSREVKSSGGAEPLIRATRTVGSTRGFAYRGFVG